MNVENVKKALEYIKTTDVSNWTTGSVIDHDYPGCYCALGHIAIALNIDLIKADQHYCVFGKPLGIKAEDISYIWKANDDAGFKNAKEATIGLLNRWLEAGRPVK